MLNHIVLMGRLTREPDLRRLPDDTAVLNFSIAVDRDYLDRDGERGTDFVDIVAFRGTADFVQKYFRKGSMIVVSGRLRVRNWKDRDGFKRRSTEVVADQAYFGEAKRREAERAEPEQAPEWVQAADALEALGDELADLP